MSTHRQLSAAISSTALAGITPTMKLLQLAVDNLQAQQCTYNQLAQHSHGCRLVRSNFHLLAGIELPHCGQEMFNNLWNNPAEVLRFPQFFYAWQNCLQTKTHDSIKH